MPGQKKEKIKIFGEVPPVEEAGIEVAPKPEAEIKKKVEKAPSFAKASEGEGGEGVTLTPPIGGEEAVLPKDPMVEKIEKVLQEDLERVYLLMTPEQQKVFKDKGEETASKIRILVQQVKIKVKEILNLIKKWLITIPGVNKFFIEQEAKIKTDKILEMAEERKKK
jgi:hypothetical protein